MLSKDVSFPGFLALPPTLGAAALIWSGLHGRSWASRVLSVRPLVWIGLISYAAYLWHWPLLAFYRYAWGHVGLAAGAIIVFATMVLAWLTYRFVEQPLRHGRMGSLGRRPRLTAYFAVSATVVVVALAAQYIDGYGWHYLSPLYRQQLQAQLEERAAPASPGHCLAWRLAPADLDSRRCVVGNAGRGEPSVLLWGDSNADHYVGLLSAFARQGGWSFRVLTHSACPPLLGTPMPYLSSGLKHHWADCIESLRLVQQALGRYDVIVISASWPSYQARSSTFMEAVQKTVSQLTRDGRRVILMAKAPVFPANDPYCEAKALRFPFLDCAVTRAPAIADRDVVSGNLALEKLAQQIPGVGFFDMSEYMCRGGVCSPLGADGRKLYRNPGHIDTVGSRQLGEEILARQGVPAPFENLAGPR